MANMSEPGKRKKRKKDCCSIETAVNRVIILSAFAVSLFEQTYQGKKQTGGKAMGCQVAQTQGDEGNETVVALLKREC